MIIHCHQNAHNPHTLSDIHLQLLGMLSNITLEKMYTLSIHAIFFSSVYNPPHEPQASSFCAFFPLFMMDMMVWVVLFAQTEKIPLQKDCFWSSYVVFCSQATEEYP